MLSVMETRLLFDVANNAVADEKQVPPRRLRLAEWQSYKHKLFHFDDPHCTFPLLPWRGNLQPDVGLLLQHLADMLAQSALDSASRNEALLDYNKSPLYRSLLISGFELLDPDSRARLLASMHDRRPVGLREEIQERMSEAEDDMLLLHGMTRQAYAATTKILGDALRLAGLGTSSQMHNPTYKFAMYERQLIAAGLTCSLAVICVPLADLLRGKSMSLSGQIYEEEAKEDGGRTGLDTRVMLGAIAEEEQEEVEAEQRSQVIITSTRRPSLLAKKQELIPNRNCKASSCCWASNGATRRKCGKEVASERTALLQTLAVAMRSLELSAVLQASSRRMMEVAQFFCA